MSLGRPRDGKEIKKVYSVRLEPSVKDRLSRRYGSIQDIINGIINGTFKLVRVKNDKSK